MSSRYTRDTNCWRNCQRALICAFWLLAGAAQALQLDADDRRWIAQHPTVRVVSDGGAPPFDFIADNGAHAGLMVDYLAEVASRTGLKFDWLSVSRRDQLADALRNGQGQLLIAYGLSVPADLPLVTVQRAVVHDYPVLVTRSNGNVFSNARASAQRINLVHAYPPGLAYAAQFPARQYLQSENFEPALAEVALGLADASVQGLAVANYLIRERGLTNLHIAGVVGRAGDSQPVQWQVAKNAEPLAHIIEQAWDDIPPEQHRALRERWLAKAQTSDSLVPRSPLPTPSRSQVLLLALAIAIALAGFTIIRRLRRRRAAIPADGLVVLDRLLEQSQGFIFEMAASVDGEMRVSVLSREARRLFGLEDDRKDVALDVLLRSVVAEDHAAIFNTIRQSASDGQQAEVEYRVSRPNGRRWLKSVMRPRQEADGRTVWSGVTTNITVQKNAERSAEQTEQYLREITDNVPGVVYQFQRDLSGHYQFNFASAAMAELRGMNHDQVNARGETMFDTMHEDDRQRIHEIVEKSAVSLQPYEVEYRVRMPNGQIAWMHGNAVPTRRRDGTVVWNGYTGNVTRLKNVQERLQASERFILDITDNIPGHLYQLQQSAGSLIHRLSYISAGIASHGLSVKQALQNSVRIYERVLPEDQLRLRSAFANSAREVTPVRVDYRLRLSSGEIAWMRTHAVPNRQPDGGLVWNGITHNISEEKLHQVEAERAKERLQSIANTLPGLVYQRAMSQTGEITFPYLSEASHELLQVDPKAIMEDLNTYTSLIFSDDLRRSDLAFEQSERDGTQVRHEFRLRRADGSIRWMRTLAQPQGYQGGVFLWSGFTQDITAEKEAQARTDTLQQRLVEITANVPCVVFQLHRNFAGELRLLFISDSIYALTGISREQAEQDIQLLIRQIVPSQLPAFIESLDTSLLQQRPVFLDFEFHGTDGVNRWVRASISMPRLEDGGQVWSGAWQDITDIKELQSDLDDAKRAAESASRLKSEFLANMSHEIRTPMNAVIGLGQLVMQTQLTPRQRNYIGKINTASQSLLGILNDILDLSKIEAGKMSLERTEFDLNRVLDNLSGLMNLKAAEKELELHFQVAIDTPMRLLGDPLRLGQVLINLTSNAIKFSEHGEILLHIRQQFRDADGVSLQFEISDQGIGLSNEQIRRLFHSFSQGDASTTRKYGGTGLGLSISRNLIRLMGGEIEVESQPGQGSTFRFSVRFGLSDAPQPRYELPQHLHGVKALVVDGTALSREVLSGWLTAFGFTVTSVESGMGALEILANSIDAPFRLAFLDWRMPDLNGMEIAGRIQKLNLIKQPTIIICSAYASEEVVRQAEDTGVYDFLSKPVSPAALFEASLSALEPAVANIDTSPDGGMPLDSGPDARTSVVDDQLLRWSALPATASALPVLRSLDATPAFDGPLLDLSSARRRLGGNEALFQRLLQRFQSDHLASAATIADALAAGDLELACRESHNLKGVAANLGAKPLSIAAASLETSTRAGTWTQLERDNLLIIHRDTLAAMQAVILRTSEAESTAIEPLPQYQVLARLERLLEAHDADAKELCLQLDEQLGAHDSLALRRLRLAVENYQFETALSSLHELRAELKSG